MNHPPSPLRVLFLGPLREQTGRDSDEVPCPPDGSQSVFWELLKQKYPSLSSQIHSLRLARGNEFLDPPVRLRPGDELALIPPVSGG